ncbi:unnamed protein product, partial [Ectocarpus sp. 12 AP-2014]
MSEVAINALTVDLTRLLSSAKGRQSTEDLAETTSLFRQCKQNSGVKENSETVARDVGEETSTALGTPVGSSLTRKMPLPDEVDRCMSWILIHRGCMMVPIPNTFSPLGWKFLAADLLLSRILLFGYWRHSCCYAYAPLGDQKPTTAAAAEEEEIKARPPARRARPASPSHGDVDRRAYTYADGFKPRRRDQQPPEATYFSFSQNGASRKWHHRRSDRRRPVPHFPGRQHQHHQHHQHHQQQQQQQQQQNQQQHQQQQDQLRQDPDAQVNHEAPSRDGEGGTDTAPTARREDAQPRDTVLVGEAWSENAVGGVEGSLGRDRDRASVGDTGSQRPSAESRRDTSELHEFLYREGRSREDRRRAKQAERDRELTFRPRLATTKYWAAATARRRRRSMADDFGLVAGRGGDGAGAAAEDPRVGSGMERLEAAAAAAGGVPARFEMLYEDSKAQLLRAQEDRVKIPAACTFQPQLISHRPTSGGRGRHVARGATEAAAAASPKDADTGRETHVFDDSAELFDESVNDPHARNERGDSDGLDNGKDDDSQAWVSSLVFGDKDEDDGRVDNSTSSGTNDNGDNNNAKRTEEGQGQGRRRGQEQHGDRPRRFDRHGSRLRTPRAGLRGENGRGYGEIGSSSNGALSPVDGPFEEGSKGSRRDGDYNRRDCHRRSRSLPSRSRGVTRTGLSDGVGGRAEAVGTPSYAERLYRGHDEQQQVWARRQVSRQERARLELKGCTFRPRLDQNSQNLGRAGRTYLVPPPPLPAEGQNGGAQRRSSSAVRWKRTTPHEEEEEEDASGREGGMAAVAAAHERLYQAAEQVRARRREE